MVYWLLLLVTIIFEVAGTIAMKLSNGLTKLVPSVLIFVFYGICFSVFAIVVKKIHLSIAYAIWSGVGTLLITIISVYFLKSILVYFKHFVFFLLFWVSLGLRFHLHHKRLSSSAEDSLCFVKTPNYLYGRLAHVCHQQ